MPTEALDPAVFKAVQDTLKARGKKTDKCAVCGCSRTSHLPKDFFLYAKSGFSSGNAMAIPNIAPTHCDCKHCLCSCVAFVEPTKKRPRMRCFGDVR